MLTVVSYCWGKKYDRSYVTKLAAGIRRHLAQPHRTALITDQPDLWGIFDEIWPLEHAWLTDIPGCYVRLMLFNLEWQARHNIALGHRVVCIDLDVVITGSLDPLFDRPELFVILQGANTSNPCPYNGSIFMLRGGANPEVWSGFNIVAARSAPFHSFPDDQGWMWNKMPDAAGWPVGPESGVYAFRKNKWPHDDVLPKDARLVAFPGWRDPSKFGHLPWVEGCWR